MKQPGRTPSGRTLAGWLRALLPRACPGCAEPLGRSAGLCPACRAALVAEASAHSTLTRAREPHLVTLGRYEGRLRRAVRALKYEGSREVAGALAARLAPAVPSGWGVRAVVAVPLHPARLRERGYNQAELLARAVARELGVPCLPGLRRVRATRQQAKLAGAERAENVRGAFAAVGGVAGPVLLVDDVLTTGHTCRAAAEALRAGGAEAVYFLTAAR